MSKWYTMPNSCYHLYRSHYHSGYVSIDKRNDIKVEVDGKLNLREVVRLYNKKPSNKLVKYFKRGRLSRGESNPSFIRYKNDKVVYEVYIVNDEPDFRFKNYSDEIAYKRGYYSEISNFIKKCIEQDNIIDSLEKKYKELHKLERQKEKCYDTLKTMKKHDIKSNDNHGYYWYCDEEDRLYYEIKYLKRDIRSYENSIMEINPDAVILPKRQVYFGDYVDEDELSGLYYGKSLVKEYVYKYSYFGW